jgi:hypothetical protein
MVDATVPSLDDSMTIIKKKTGNYYEKLEHDEGYYFTIAYYGCICLRLFPIKNVLWYFKFIKQTIYLILSYGN